MSWAAQPDVYSLEVYSLEVPRVAGFGPSTEHAGLDIAIVIFAAKRNSYAALNINATSE